MSIPLFLHIGTGKTGTTALQNFFSQNRNILKNLGLLYPTNGCIGLAHYNLSRVLGFGPKIGQRDEVSDSERLTLQAELTAEIRASKTARAVLLSSEYFSNPKQLELTRNFFANYPLKVLIYLRRHDSWWESAYNQAVKTVVNPPWGRGIEAFIRFQKRKNPQHRNHRYLVDRWAAVFGADNLIIRPYEALQNQPNIVVDCLHALNLKDIAEKLNPQSDRINQSLSPLALSLIDSYQRAKLSEPIRARLIQSAYQLTEDTHQNSILSPQLRRQLVDENCADYEYIAKTYLKREDGQLFYQPLPDPNETWEPWSWPSLAKIVEMTVAALEK
jgi:hypothetical protein